MAENKGKEIEKNIWDPIYMFKGVMLPFPSSKNFRMICTSQTHWKIYGLIIL